MVLSLFLKSASIFLPNWLSFGIILFRLAYLGEVIKPPPPLLVCLSLYGFLLRGYQDRIRVGARARKWISLMVNVLSTWTHHLTTIDITWVMKRDILPLVKGKRSFH